MQSNPSILTFLGGAETVTGSKILLDAFDRRILIDCGLFQGLKELRKLNWAKFPVNPDTIHEIILTHAHLDHTGYLPLLVKNGFKGPVHCTLPTRDLTEIILFDSAKIQEEDANRADKHHYSKHEHPRPLYTIQDVVDTLPLLISHELHEWVLLSNELRFQFLNNGHILGSAFVEMHINGNTIVYSGDIGKQHPMLIYPPKKIKNADYLVLESTYGERLHEEEPLKNLLLNVIEETLDRKGILMIPSFAVERAQEIIYLLYQLEQEQKLPKVPIFLDSPMGVKTTSVYNSFHEWQNISRYDAENMYDQVHFITNFEQSKAVVQNREPKIVIAGSGMMEGGRILHYLNNHIENERNTLLFVGFQCEGTRGRSILEGSDYIKFFGEYRKVKCQIRSITSLSAHGDQADIIKWLRNFEKPPKTTFINHGEPHQSDALRVKIEHELGWKVKVAKMNVPYELS
jgi:metallo-beta-lactamase family protein